MHHAPLDAFSSTPRRQWKGIMVSVDLPPSAGPEAIVTVSAIETGYVECDRAQIVDPCASERIKIPVIAFLIEKDGKTYTFDLGLRPDLYAVPQHVQDVEYPEFPPTSLRPLPASLPEGMTIDTAILSHYHWDHVGNPGLLEKGTRCIFGKGSLGAIGTGYPDGDPWIDAAWLSHCEFTEVEFDTGPIGDFPAGKDFFGDGSLWLIDCPGHCAGNMVALARVTTSPDTYIMLGGDCCHDQALYAYPCHHGIAKYTTSHGDEVTLHEDHAAAKENMKRLHRMSQRDNVMVIVAHEREALGILPFLDKSGENRGALRDWKAKGWKEMKLKPKP